MEARHYIGDLDAGVVDIILHLDLLAERSQHADERIAQRRVPKVADMRRLIRIDVGMLYNDLFRRRLRGLDLAREQAGAICRAVETDIDVAGARDLHGRNAFDRNDLRDQFLGNLFRGLSQLLGKLEGDGDGQLTEIRLLGLLDHQLRRNTVPDGDVRFKGLLDALFE